MPRAPSAKNMPQDPSAKNMPQDPSIKDLTEEVTDPAIVIISVCSQLKYHIYSWPLIPTMMKYVARIMASTQGTML